MNLISSKIAKHVDVLKMFASIALRPVGLQQLLHYVITTHCWETLAQTLAMWWASEHFPTLPSHLVRNNSVQGCQFGFFDARFWNSGFFWTPLAFFWKSNQKKPDKIWLFFSRKSLALEKHCLSCISIKNLFWKESITM